MIKSKKQMFIVIGAFALVMFLGTVTYAFFNYTRTGTANVIRTGQINFTTTQTSGQNGAISLTNVFPIDVSEGVPSNDPNVGEVTINITGNTEYTGGIEYLVSATNVTNTVGTKTIPIGVNITATSGLGTSDNDYFTDKENNPQTSIYKVLVEDTIEDDTDLLVGYIKSGETGVNGNVVIKAYLDDSKIAISDTYYGNVTATPTPTAPTDEYGTPESMAEGKVVLTTTEWNSLQSSGISFQVKVEAREGTWTDAPSVPEVLGCNGCKFAVNHTIDGYIYSIDNMGGNSYPISTLSDFETNNDELTEDYTTLNSNIFLGFKFDESGNVTNAYSCGINPNSNIAFCLEGTSKYSDQGQGNYASEFSSNIGILNTAFPECYDDDNENRVDCYDIDEIHGYAGLNGSVGTSFGDYVCYVENGVGWCQHE